MVEKLKIIPHWRSYHENRSDFIRLWNNCTNIIISLALIDRFKTGWLIYKLRPRHYLTLYLIVNKFLVLIIKIYIHICFAFYFGTFTTHNNCSTLKLMFAVQLNLLASAIQKFIRTVVNHVAIIIKICYIIGRSTICIYNFCYFIFIKSKQLKTRCNYHEQQEIYWKYPYFIQNKKYI